ncbi:RrF2 family transcriptional regulator [Aquamicrobium ahrensii]|uniref:RrF2 family transcriptional regulator n=1 Tax=Aquamicrobium ahrensii TaxID=469551 RepID=UPI003398C8E4
MPPPTPSAPIRLARTADTITLGEVVRFLEQRHATVECFRADGGACLLTSGCRLRPQLAAAREAFIAELDKTSVASCAYPGSASEKPLCAAP